ncbi:TPA: hypothetical protein DDW69_04350 [candidate division CPR2 bacterium]|uniref:NTP pyrophosphohydrolase MazG putative catalytic core domain-containing protein n=1 Tax=candidate division CPR2 bacterium GW2011_GWC1_41_48 TaxID=1618344 RepID=A0A0G0Z8C0_UNCC2|nr:MAG: hypothetical protein UT47_C0002G0248 [candidate division CPR2 bacterium GW2011_GWC2_39_35]KKR28056.1 MAG: hypothetical protein UT59_C0036G0009 [candidate division CPR2 bacterium GW2011_GWD1_39_7]KKR29107.1 MAG: hypothetical protein UT60_C0007G0052 [candidate division CPR2 bacterium GW2011_GWD2_39_7]KKS09278.1 MAG: hypothetical protein UU65_C0002G0056 [candidate division CPR2 bacterium GW2011_GWC1_41_48]OGB60277.1 MAG: hypothetical protein A2Y27_03630 [candidate division CPR2 bacterium G
MDKIKQDVSEILELYGSHHDEKGKFYHVLEEIGKHLIKLTRLKENEDRPGHFKEEVADIYLLTLSLLELEGIDNKVLLKASDHFLEKVKEIYGSSN